MTSARTTALTLLAAVSTLTGCYGPGSHTHAAGPGTAHTNRASAAMVIEGHQLRQGDRTLLSLLRGRVTAMNVHHRGDACPEVTLRGPKSLTGSSNPAIYVDGTRAANTCILEMINPTQISRVEVYPMGMATSVPGIRSSSNGIILIYLLDGSEEETPPSQSST
jgi:hypothetical protein